jgi:hypothetical protein
MFNFFLLTSSVWRMVDMSADTYVGLQRAEKVGGAEDCTNYRGPAGRKEARDLTMLRMFLSFSVVSDVIKQWFVISTALAASAILLPTISALFPYFLLAGPPLLSGPEHTLGSPGASCNKVPARFNINLIFSPPESNRTSGYKVLSRSVGSVRVDTYWQRGGAAESVLSHANNIIPSWQ